MLAFHLTADQAELFFQLCEMRDAKTEEGRTEILTQMARHGEVTNVVQTAKTKDEYVQHLAKNFKVAKLEKNK